MELAQDHVNCPVLILAVLKPAVLLSITYGSEEFGKTVFVSHHLLVFSGRMTW
jgi:hypothetical protein